MSLENKLRVGRDEVGEKGDFVRQSYDFKAEFGSEDLPIEAGKYRLFWGKICQWSNWHSIILDILGLSDGAVTHNIVEKDVNNLSEGWQFLYDEEGKDPVLKVHSLNELYMNTDSNYKGRMTTPCMVDIKTKKVISNDFHSLPYQLEKDLKPLHKEGAPNLLPSDLEEDIKLFNKWLYHNINNAVYRTSFCVKKEAYWADYHIFFASMEKLEKRLSKNRFLFGDYITDSDIKLYNTLTRLDIRYSYQLGQVKKPLYSFQHLWAYARELYQIPEFSQNTFFSDFALPSNKPSNHFYKGFNERFLDQIEFNNFWGKEADRSYLSADPQIKFYFD